MNELILSFNSVLAFRDGTESQEKAIATFKEHLESAFKECRNFALEEAAKVTESFSEDCSPELTHADAIRSLKNHDKTN
jgi:hypothetical protein